MQSYNGIEHWLATGDPEATELVVLVRITIAMTRANWGGKGFICLKLPYHCSSSKEVWIRTQAGQGPGDKSWRVLLNWLAPYGLPSLLSYWTQDPHSRGGTIHNSYLRKCSILWRHLLNWGALLSDDSSSVKGDRQTQMTLLEENENRDTDTSSVGLKIGLVVMRWTCLCFTLNWCWQKSW